MRRFLIRRGPLWAPNKASYVEMDLKVHILPLGITYVAEVDVSNCKVHCTYKLHACSVKNICSLVGPGTVPDSGVWYCAHTLRPSAFVP